MPEPLRRLIWPALALLLLLGVNALLTPTFFYIGVMDGRIVGSLVDVFDRGAPLILVALGMTLVIATGGVDLSVGALMAIAGAVAASAMAAAGASSGVAIAAALGACTLAGAFNGALVAIGGVQPIVATLILMVAGRGVAQLITDGRIIPISPESGLAMLDSGVLFGVPSPILLCLAAFVGTVCLTRLTAFGLLVEAVGGNETAARYAGVDARAVRFCAYVLTGLFAGLAGLIEAADITNADANNIGLYLELDAILAVVIGGTALTGGRFSLGGTLLGVLIIRVLTVTILSTQLGGRSLPVEWNLIVKAAVVLGVCLLQSPTLSRGFGRRRRAS